MNVNQMCSEINNIFEFVVDQYKDKIQPKEREWIKQAITEIKNPDKCIKIEDTISRQVDGLHSFTSDQIIHLVNMLQLGMKQDTINEQVHSHFCQKVAAFVLQNNIPIDRLLKESADKNFALEVVVQQIKKSGLLPLKAAKSLIGSGIDTHSTEVQWMLIEIAKLAVQQNSETTSKHIQSYGIDASKPQGQQAMIYIAKLGAQQDAFGISKYINNYAIDASKLEGQEALIEIAKLAAKHSDWQISKYIKNYGIDASKPEGQLALIEIAKLAALNNGQVTSEYIKKYGIDASKPEGQQALIEIAKFAAQQDGERTSEHIKNYDINASTSEGLQALLEIAKLAAQQNGWGTSYYIQNYGFDASKPEGQQALIEIAKLAAQQGGRGTSLYIKKYGINAATPEGQQAIIEIAKLAAQQDGCGTSDYIKNYGIDSSKPKGRQALIEIAMLAAQQNGEETSKYIKNYGFDVFTLEGQQALIEIAKLAARQSGSGTSELIKNYGIDASTSEGQQALIDIAKLAAQQDGRGTSYYIQNYGIDANAPEGQQALIEIAKLAAQQNGEGTSMYIQNYDIDVSKPEGQQALIEIAKLAARQSSRGISINIKNYGFDASKSEGQRALIEIAKLAAQQSGEATSMFIKNYGIDVSMPKGQQALIEIAKLSAQQNARGTLNHIENYSLDTDSMEGKKRYVELTQFLFTCLVKQNSSFKYSDFYQTFDVYAKKCNGDGVETHHIDFNRFDSVHKQLKDGDMQGALKKSIINTVTLFDIHPEELQWIQLRVSSLKDKAEQAEFLEQWMCLASLCASRKGLKTLIKQNGAIFEMLFRLSPALKIRILQEVIVSSLDSKSLFMERLKADLIKESSLVHKIAVLPRDLRMEMAEIFLGGCHNLQAERVKCLQEEASDVVHAQLACYVLADFPRQGWEEYLSTLDVIKKDRSFRDAKYQQPLLNVLLAIKKSCLDDAAKISLLKQMFTCIDMKDRIEGIKLILDILNFQGESYLGEVVDLAALKATLERLFIDKCKVKVDNFGALYQNSVGIWRCKEALLTYAGKHVRNPKVLPYFQRYLTAVLQGNFSQNRYAVENNPHLDQIKKSHPNVFDVWQKPVSLTSSEITSKSDVKVISVEAKVVENLKQAVVNRHLGLEQQEALFPVVSACKDNWYTLDTSLELIEQQLEPLSNRRLIPDELSQKQRLQLQKFLLELLIDPSDLENKLNVLKGIQVKGLEQTLAPFYHDLEDAVQMLRSSQKSSSEKMKVIESDDPNHFLLMGTEVLSSCQNVNGSASLNVGVLGYALDGKHRLALVCDSSGKILARSVLRLLIDAKGYPVLFQERVYVADASPEYPSLLRKIALKKAELLGVPLVVSPSDFEKEKAQPYSHAIEAKGKPVPFEYVDALGGLQSGAYKIYKCLQIKNNTPSGS